jgi:polysaccharide pyruvyl transferase WcaK-like protein
MNILIENGCYDLLNFGDIAMLQVTVARLNSLRPGSSIAVITDTPDRLAKYVPNASPIAANGRQIWFKDRKLIGGFDRVLPDILVRLFSKLWRQIRHRWPRLARGLIEFNARHRPADVDQMNTFLETLLQADMLVVSGGGNINDEFMAYAMTLLDVLEMSTQYGVPTVMFGQGIGPVDNPKLRARAKAVLPLVDFIAVRENLTSPSILKSLGVKEEQIIVTGDDAVELAYNCRSAKLGKNIGANLRVSAYSNVNNGHVELIRKALVAAALEYNVKLIGLPISLYNDSSDVEVLGRLLKGYSDGSDSGQTLDSPREVIEKINSCRIVVTGSYHSAVFALSQGTPVVALSNSAYYKHKFLGLSEQFGRGCKVLFLDDGNLAQKLAARIDATWRSAEQLRPQLLASAQAQIVQSNSAYQRAYELVEQRKRQIAHVRQR